MGKRTNMAAAAALATVIGAGACGTTQTAPSSAVATTTAKRNNPVSEEDFRKIIAGLGYKDAVISYDYADQHAVATVAILGLKVEVDQIGTSRDTEIDHIGNKDEFTAAELGVASLKNLKYDLLAGALADRKVRQKFGGK